MINKLISTRHTLAFGFGNCLTHLVIVVETRGRSKSGSYKYFRPIKSEAEDRESFINAGDVRDDSIPDYRYWPISRKGFTLLHYAMIYGTLEVVEHLLDYDAG